MIYAHHFITINHAMIEIRYAPLGETYSYHNEDLAIEDLVEKMHESDIFDIFHSTSKALVAYHGRPDFDYKSFHVKLVKRLNEYDITKNEV